MVHGPKGIAAQALVAALCVIASSVTARADVIPLGPLEASAISDNPSLEAREARVRAAAARIEAVRAEMRPRASFDMGVSAQPGAIIEGDCGGTPCFLRGQAAGTSNGTVYIPSVIGSATVRLDGVIYDFGRTRARTNATRAEMEAQEADLAAAEDAIVRTVRGTYLNWLAVYLRRRSTEAGLEVADQRVRDIATAMASGSRSEADRESAAIEASRLRLEVARARAAESTARRTLARVVGETLAEDGIPDEALLEIAAPSSATHNGEAEARALELRRDVATAGRRAYELRHAPILSVSLQANAGVQFAYQSNPLFAPSYTVQIGLTVPLWDPRTQSFVVDEAIAQAQALESASEEARVTLTHAEDEARRRLADAEQEIVLATEIVAATQRLAAGVEQRFRVAGGSIDTVLNAHERSRRAEEDLLRSRLDRADAVLRLTPVR